MLQNKFSLQDKNVLVTGATGLIGRQHCYALRDAGANVILSDIDQKACEQLATEMGEKVFPLAFDISVKSEVEQAKQTILDKFHRLDVLVNNAAINEKFEDPAAASEKSKFENFPLEIWQKMMDVNITGIFLCCQVFGSEMAKLGKGNIINIASTYGVVAPDQSLYQDENGKQKFYKSAAYPVSKSAVIAMTRYLAAYWGEQAVRVNTLSPGGVENSQDEFFVQNYLRRTALKRMAKSDDYQGAIVFLASDASAYMTGANLLVDGGWTIC